MGITKISILIVLVRIADKGGTHYVKPKPATLLNLLEKYQGIKISRRWLFQCLQDLESKGYITRRRRFSPRSSDSTFFQLPGIIAFTLNGCEFLACRGISGASKVKKLISAWLNRKDGRFPQKPQVAPGSTPRPQSPGHHISEVLSNLVPGG